MCVVSEKIKFCTCKSASTDKLNNYWLLHRFEKNKHEFVMGTPIFPSKLTDPNFLINSTTLENRLNEPGAFDSPIAFKPKDQLEIVFNNLAKDYSKRITYCFRFKNGKWVEEEQDVFDLMNHYEEFTFGKMKNFKAPSISNE